MIAIIDYGVGNIKAFANIYKNLNIPYRIVSKASALDGADKIILPGVGAFDHAMKSLNASGMRDILDRSVLEKNVPVLGICVGMQMLARSSEEGVEPGLGWVNGIVRKFDVAARGKNEPLPHMGWNTILPLHKEELLKGIATEPRFYFLHSYYFACEHKEDVVAITEYRETFASVIRSGNICGIQCHPEKSHRNGIQVLRNFGEI